MGKDLVHSMRIPKRAGVVLVLVVKLTKERNCLKNVEMGSS